MLTWSNVKSTEPLIVKIGVKMFGLTLTFSLKSDFRDVLNNLSSIKEFEYIFFLIFRSVICSLFAINQALTVVF